ncbi:proteoglycan 4a isoform X2 [Xiphias gladius]|uniref:proteoglycan 4a isoform X2 n=1 Tax=Xiphias gladius TaxID=8245 RepID=UPI001A98E0CA|nr:proteoglycan 4a isoform X2 [Xiphias gladius]
MMMRMMMKISLWLLLLGLAWSSADAGPGTCLGRCGEIFTRGQKCTCDFSCLQHNECCRDFEATCTNAQSCQGRCSEPFRRGRLCECGPQCIRHKTCCRDYQQHCDASVSVSHPRTSQPPKAAVSGNRKLERSKNKSNSESEEQYTGLLNPPTASSSGPATPALPTNQLHYGLSNISAGLPPLSIPSSNGGIPDSIAPISALPRYSVLSQGSRAPVSPSGPEAVGGKVKGSLELSPGGVAPYGSSQGLAGSRTRLSTLQDVSTALELLVVDAGSEGPGAGLFADVDLCSDSPINGLTALSNGTILIFKGELFWSVDPVSRLAGHPQSITDTLGVAAPIDTVFTRCNCHRNTYITKGDQYWRLDGNMVVEPGFPKPLAAEFPGLTGPISAALAAPATRSRAETVYFFKNGDIMQSFTFPAGSTPSCSTKPRSPFKKRLTTQDARLSGEINIKVSLKDFPTPVTSALSMPSPQRSDRYHHYVFSGPVFFSVRTLGDLPALARPDSSAALAPLPILSPAAIATDSAKPAAQNANPTYPALSIRVWLHCP